jgi:dTDP-4-dehydrorhamnose reductase
MCTERLSMSFLLLGGTGQVGREICILAARKDIEVVAPLRSEVDFVDASAIAHIVAAKPWGAVINAAAYTDVERAEREEQIAVTTNAEAPSRLAAETAQRGIPLIHISTDYVFDGWKGAPYLEQDETRPLNAYGRTKLAGERGVRVANPRHVILRTSWVFSPYGKNFVKTILRLAAERQILPIVADQRGCPTAAHDVASACLEIAMRCASNPDAIHYGTYHFAGAGEASWFDFASAIVEQSADHLRRTPQIVPIGMRDYPTSAARPVDTRLDCTAIKRHFLIEPRPWQQELAYVIVQLLSSRGMP